MTVLDRLLGVEGIEPNTRIPIHTFSYILMAYAQGAVTLPQARTYVEGNFGGTLTAGEITQFQEYFAILDSNGPELTPKLQYAELTEAVLGIATRDTTGLTSKAWVKSALGITND